MEAEFKYEFMPIKRQIFTIAFLKKVSINLLIVSINHKKTKAVKIQFRK